MSSRLLQISLNATNVLQPNFLAILARSDSFVSGLLFRLWHFPCHIGRLEIGSKSVPIVSTLKFYWYIQFRPRLAIDGTERTRLHPNFDAMQMKPMLTHSPGDWTFSIVGFVELAEVTIFQMRVSAYGTGRYILQLQMNYGIVHISFVFSKERKGDRD